MNDKGFTLIELIVVVGILALLGTIITVSLTNTFSNTNKMQCEEFVREVEDAACVYVGLSTKEIICTRNNCEPITLRVLVQEGLIKSEIDACTKEKINLDKTVTVTWNNNGEKICTYNGVSEYER